MLGFTELSQEELRNIVNNTNWPAFGKCLLSNGGAEIPELAELVQAVKNNDWARAKDLCLYSSVTDVRLVANCLVGN